MSRIIEHDLDRITERSVKYLDHIRNKRFFITGGTGFIGKWICMALDRINQATSANIEAVLLSRRSELPLVIKNLKSNFELHQGDVIDFDFPKGDFDYIIHAATDTKNDVQGSLTHFESIVFGSKRVLDFAASLSPKRLLYLSSGAIYGELSSEHTHVNESYYGGPNCLDYKQIYGESKRAAELLCAVYSNKDGLSFSIARCFAMIGPLMALDTHYALGNFISNASYDEIINVKTNGIAYRSFIYIQDLIVWLFTILVFGESGKAYNVGSEEAISLKDLANLTAKVCNSQHECQFGKRAPKERINYVPDTSYARDELDLNLEVSLEEAIMKTFTYQRSVLHNNI